MFEWYFVLRKLQRNHREKKPQNPIKNPSVMFYDIDRKVFKNIEE